MFTRTSSSKDKLEVCRVASTMAFETRRILEWRRRHSPRSSAVIDIRFSRTQPHEPHIAKCSAELASANVRPAP
jgi:hypothetical protein